VTNIAIKLNVQVKFQAGLMQPGMNSDTEIPKAMENTLFDRTFRDSEGKIVLAQMPNLPILVWGTASLLQLLLTSGKIQTGLDLVAFGSLFTWAWQEVFQGVNYFRRALGFVVLVGAIAFRLQGAAGLT
jgi:hypothetical protein